MLISFDDFSTVEYVFDYIDQDPVIHAGQFLDVLKDIALNLPQYSEPVKKILLNVKDNSELSDKREHALEYLILLFGENNLEVEIRFSVTNDPDTGVR